MGLGVCGVLGVGTHGVVTGLGVCVVPGSDIGCENRARQKLSSGGFWCWRCGVAITVTQMGNTGMRINFRMEQNKHENGKTKSKPVC